MITSGNSTGEVDLQIVKHETPSVPDDQELLDAEKTVTADLREMGRKKPS